MYFFPYSSRIFRKFQTDRQTEIQKNNYPLTFVFKQIRKLIATVNASNLPKEPMKMEPSSSTENITMMVLERVRIPNRRSITNLDDSRGIRDQKIPERRLKRIEKATRKKTNVMNLPLNKGMAALYFLQGKNFQL